MFDARVLGALPFAAGLPAPALAELAGIARAQAFPAKAVIFREGVICPDLFVVEAGRVAIEMHVPGRGAVRVLTVGDGELLGWSALLGDGRMTATAMAIDDTRLVVIPGNSLRDLCQRSHEVGWQVMQQVAKALSARLIATRLQLLDLFAINR